jgi:FkbM family methyltransferase
MDRAKVVDFVGRVPVLGTTLRKLARRYPEGSVADVRTGVAAGLKWKRHHRYLNGYWVGHFELDIQNALKRELKPGDVVYDVGANAGFFTLIAAHFVGPAGKVVAFDPAPENCESVREQVELNGYAPFCTAVQKAVGGRAGRATFSFAASGSPMGHLGGAERGERSVEVEVTTLDDAVAAYGAPTFIKLDVEGAEGDVMAGAGRLLASAGARPRWLIELHNPQCEADVKRDLAAAGYQFFNLDATPVPPGAELPHHVIARPT